MDRGAWWATVCGDAESDMTERLTTPLLLLKNKKTQRHINCNIIAMYCIHLEPDSNELYVEITCETIRKI